jgi:hypothetical protein
MKTANFEKLIQAITGRDFKINTSDTEILGGKEYYISRFLPLTERNIGFKWKAAVNDEKMLRSFITAFTTKYREPNPKAYDREYGGVEYTWAEKTDKEKEYAYSHHASNMYYKTELMQQVNDNFCKVEIKDALIKYGFYATEYGIGIFCFWETPQVVEAIKQMSTFLQGNSIPYVNEYSDARWVFRFKLNINKEAHETLLNTFTNN